MWGFTSSFLEPGTWDIAYESKELDNFKNAMDEFSSESDGDDWYTEPDDLTGDTDVSRGNVSIAQTESENLVSLIRALTPSELAGYVSCLVADSARGGAASVVDSFQRLDFAQQRVIQSSLLAMERLMEVQNKFSVDQGSSRAQLELGTCDVVTAWAAGCSWSEALEMSGTAPGDLVRVLNRALDALRQFGNLPYMPVRGTYSENDEDDNSNTVQAIAPGIHPDIRRLCREAAQAMDRYPVKDPLPFDEDDDIVNELELIENEETETGISVEG
jgi:superfamily II RNA helicase